MVSVVNIAGFQAFEKFADTIDKNGPPLYIYFTGSKLADGKSWCPDCNDAMVKKKIIRIDNYDAFTEFVDNLPEKKRHVYFFFTGANKENGRSWCIYCQLAEPVVKAYLEELKTSIIFAYVDVGDRDYWKDKACPFRTDKRTHLMVIPTIIKWNGVQRLEGSQCNKRELLQLMFEDED